MCWPRVCLLAQRGVFGPEVTCGRSRNGGGDRATAVRGHKGKDGSRAIPQPAGCNCLMLPRCASEMIMPACVFGAFIPGISIHAGWLRCGERGCLPRRSCNRRRMVIGGIRSWTGSARRPRRCHSSPNISRPCTPSRWRGGTDSTRPRSRPAPPRDTSMSREDRLTSNGGISETNSARARPNGSKGKRHFRAGSIRCFGSLRAGSRTGNGDNRHRRTGEGNHWGPGQSLRSQFCRRFPGHTLQPVGAISAPISGACEAHSAGDANAIQTQFQLRGNLLGSHGHAFIAPELLRRAAFGQPARSHEPGNPLPACAFWG